MIPYRQWTRSVAKQSGVSFIDFPGRLKAEMYVDEVHTNEAGAELVASAIADALNP